MSNIIVAIGAHSKVYEYGYGFGSDEVVKVSKLLTTECLREISIERICSDHPNLIRFNSVTANIQNSILYSNIVMKRASYTLNRNNTILQDKLKVALISYQLVRALIHLKTHGIIHRDVKPDNILIYDDDNERILRAVLIDYGLARFVPTNGGITGGLYTEWYRSPEVWLGHDYGYAADVWALGCTIYEVYFGKILFYVSKAGRIRYKHKPEHRINAMAAILRKVLTVTSRIDPELGLVLASTLSISPKNRISVEKLAELGWFRNARAIVENLLPFSSVSVVRPTDCETALALRSAPSLPSHYVDWRSSITVFQKIDVKSFSRACLIMEYSSNHSSNHERLAKSCCLLAAIVDGTRISGVLDFYNEDVLLILNCVSSLLYANRDEWLDVWQCRRDTHHFVRKTWNIPLRYTEEDIAATTVWLIEGRKVRNIILELEIALIKLLLRTDTSISGQLTSVTSA